MTCRNKLFVIILALLCISGIALGIERTYADQGGDNTIRFTDTVIEGQIESKEGNKLVLKLGVYVDAAALMPQAPVGESVEGQDPDLPMPQRPTGEDSTDSNIKMPQRPTGESQSTDVKMPQRPTGESQSTDVKMPQRPTGESQSTDIELPQKPTEQSEAQSQDIQPSYEDVQVSKSFVAGSTRLVLTIGDESVIEDQDGNKILLSDVQTGDLLSITIDEDGNISEILIR